MSPRTEYFDALAVLGTPAFAAASFALSFVVFGAALVVMYLKTTASLDRQARLPFDSLGKEQDHDR